MLNEFPASAVLVAKDLERAKQFYQESLGLTLLPGPPGVVLLGAGNGTMVVLYEKKEGSQAVHTVLGFAVKNLETLLRELKAKGVEQDLENLPGVPGEDGIVRYGPVLSAWIKDTEGNIIALNEMGA